MAEKSYAHVPLAKKLGLVTSKPEKREVALIGAAPGFREGLGDLPEVNFGSRISAKTALALVFVRTKPELEAAVDMLIASLPREASAWIIRPKSHHKPGFGEDDVRAAALPHGLVDYKICSVSDDWSGMKFAWRKSTR